MTSRCPHDAAVQAATVGDACLGHGEGTINPTITEVALLSSSTTERLMADYKAGGLHTILNWPYVAPVVVA